MRVNGARNSRHVGLEDVTLVGLGHLGQLVAITFAQPLLDLGHVHASQRQAQRAVFDTFAPQLIQLGHGRGPGHVLTVDDQLFISSEIQRIQFVLDKLDCPYQPLQHPAVIQVVDLIGGLQVAVFQAVVQRDAHVVNRFDIGLGHVQPRTVQHIDIIIKHFRREVVVEGDGRIVFGFQLTQQFDGGASVHGLRRHGRVQAVYVEAFRQFLISLLGGAAGVSLRTFFQSNGFLGDSLISGQPRQRQTQPENCRQSAQGVR